MTEDKLWCCTFSYCSSQMMGSAEEATKLGWDVTHPFATCPICSRIRPLPQPDVYRRDTFWGRLKAWLQGKSSLL